MAVTTEQLMALRAAKQLAVGLIHLWKLAAVTHYPGSTRANPSSWVVVYLTVKGALRNDWKVYFPYSAPGPYWNRVIAPIFENFQWRHLLKVMPIDDFLVALELGILVKAREQGFLPEDESFGLVGLLSDLSGELITEEEATVFLSGETAPQPPTGESGSGFVIDPALIEQIENHLNITHGNPHGVSLGNLLPGTLAQLNALILDADISQLAGIEKNLSSQINGTSVIFLTGTPYVPGQLRVFLNGIKMSRGGDFFESSPSAGEFTMAYPPIVGDILIVNF